MIVFGIERLNTIFITYCLQIEFVYFDNFCFRVVIIVFLCTVFYCKSNK